MRATHRTCGQSALSGPGSNKQPNLWQAVRRMGRRHYAARPAIRPAAVHWVRKAAPGNDVPRPNRCKCTWWYAIRLNAELVNSDKLIFSLVENSQNMIVTLDAPEWKVISNTAKDLVMKMLAPKAANRPTIAEILEHPWMRVNIF